jgi:hypothetical protein
LLVHATVIGQTPCSTAHTPLALKSATNQTRAGLVQAARRCSGQNRLRFDASEAVHLGFRIGLGPLCFGDMGRLSPHRCSHVRSARMLFAVSGRMDAQSQWPSKTLSVRPIHWRECAKKRDLPTFTQKTVPGARMVAFDQSRDDRSAERERVLVARCAFSDETPELVTF